MTDPAPRIRHIQKKLDDAEYEGDCTCGADIEFLLEVIDLCRPLCRQCDKPHYRFGHDYCTKCLAIHGLRAWRSKLNRDLV